jgi:hypothetical protein
VEDSAAHERRVHEQQEQEQITRACQAISVIQANVDKLSEQVQDFKLQVLSEKSIVL